jgi:hypothetical protein
MVDRVKFFRVKALPDVPVPNAIYYVRPDGSQTVTEYVVDNAGVASIVGGGGTAVVPFEFTQGSASAQWIVNHNLGRRPAAVTVLNPGGLEVIAEVVHSSLNQLIIALATPSTGRAIVL